MAVDDVFGADAGPGTPVKMELHELVDPRQSSSGDRRLAVFLRSHHHCNATRRTEWQLTREGGAVPFTSKRVLNRI